MMFAHTPESVTSVEPGTVVSDLFGRAVQATVVKPDAPARSRRGPAGRRSAAAPGGFPYVHTLAREGRRGPDAYAADEMPA
ncbi:hypothetical protein GCM10018775_28390 [Streptomyces umbrinus]|nr:hypothetical protein GCM10018775_28390 [Streptomyces umbrinus]